MPPSDDRNAAIYARVSSEQQAQQQTIASQVEALRQRVQQDGLTLPEELCFLDEGCSGSTLLRPALERLRDQATAGAIDRLYVHSPDRLARKYAYQVLLLDELKRCGVEVVFLNRHIGHSPEEDLLLQVQGMVAEYERAKILERSRRGKLHAARRGSPNVLCGAPYGYRYISRRESGDGEASYQVVEEEAAVVRQIFRWVGQERCSIGEVCRRLHREGIPSPKGKAVWDRSVVWGMLKNPAYQGVAAYGKTRIGARRARLRPLRGQPEYSRRSYSIYRTSPEEQTAIAVPALVEPALFAAVAEQLAENKQRQRQSRRGARYLLQGLVVCPHCGHAFYGKPVSRSSAKGKTRYAYYRCIGTDAYRFGGERICHNRQVRTDLLEVAVWEDVRALLADPDRVRQEYERRRHGKGREDRPIEQLQTQIGKAKRGVARLIDAYEDGLLERNEFEPRLRRAKGRLEKLEAEAAALVAATSEDQQVEVVLGQLQEFMRRVGEGLAEASWQTRREIIRALVKRVEVDTAEVRVIYKVPPHPFVEAPEGGCLQDRFGRDRPTLLKGRHPMQKAESGLTASAAMSLAAQLAKARIIDLEQPRFHGMPIHPSHKPGYFYALHRRHRDTYQPAVHGPRSGASGVLTMMEHSGTHIDALCHQACGLKVFGNLDSDSIETPFGFKTLGIEQVPPLLTRGILLDVAAWKGQTPLPREHSISADDLIACAAAQNVALEKGDVLLVRTGYDTLWQNEEIYLQAAGIGKSGTLWAAEQGVIAVGADNMAWDAPKDVDPDTGATLFGHVHLLTQKGIYIIENLDLRELARAKQYAFAFIGIPLKFQGATGSPLRPLALL